MAENGCRQRRCPRGLGQTQRAGEQPSGATRRNADALSSALVGRAQLLVLVRNASSLEYVPGFVCFQPPPMGRHVRPQCHRRKVNAPVGHILFMASCEGAHEATELASIHRILGAGPEGQGLPAIWLFSDSLRAHTPIIPKAGHKNVGGKVRCNGAKLTLPRGRMEKGVYQRLAITFLCLYRALLMSLVVSVTPA
eukprot:242156-Prymnesium_polylepis.1